MQSSFLLQLIGYGTGFCNSFIHQWCRPQLDSKCQWSHFVYFHLCCQTSSTIFLNSAGKRWKEVGIQPSIWLKQHVVQNMTCYKALSMAEWCFKLLKFEKLKSGVLQTPDDSFKFVCTDSTFWLHFSTLLPGLHAFTGWWRASDDTRRRRKSSVLRLAMLAIGVSYRSRLNKFA